MFTPAESFHGNVCGGLFTHYKRKEDTARKSGKLDEELTTRMALTQSPALTNLVNLM